MKSLFLTFLLACPHGNAAVSFITSTLKGNPVNVTSDAMNCTGANFVGVIVADQLMSAAVGTMTSSPSNTWHALADSPDGGNSHVAIWYAENATVSSSMTVTYSGGNFPLIMPMCFSLVATASSLDQGADYFFGASPLSTGPIVPGFDGELIITGTADDEATLHEPNAITGSDSACYHVVQHTALIPGVNSAGAAAYCIQTTAASTTPVWHGFVSGSSTIATFKAAVATGGVTISGPVTISGSGRIN